MGISGVFGLGAFIVAFALPALFELLHLPWHPICVKKTTKKNIQIIMNKIMIRELKSKTVFGKRKGDEQAN